MTLEQIEILHEEIEALQARLRENAREKLWLEDVLLVKARALAETVKSQPEGYNGSFALYSVGGLKSNGAIVRAVAGFANER